MFFIPLTFIYVATGVLYLFDIEGGVQQEKTFTVPLAQDWSESEETANHQVYDFLKKNYPVSIPAAYYPEEDLHDWYGYKREIIFIKNTEGDSAKLIIKEHDIWQQLLLIHKGFGGWIFTLFAVLLGLSLVFSMGSGVILIFQLPKMKKGALIAVGSGVATFIICFICGS